MAGAVQDVGMRVVVIESIPLILGGLRSALEEDGITVAAATHDPQTGVRAVRQEKPDVVLVDLDLPGRAGTRLLQQLRRQYPAPRLIASVSPERDDDSLLLTTLLAGATGYLLKTAETVDLLRTVRAVQRGYVTLGPRAGGELSALLTRLAEVDGTLPFPVLTDREREVLRLVSLGYGNRRIAQELFISEKTVRNYVSAILPKIHVSSRLEAIVSARLAGLETAGPGTGSAGT
ncbi:LuxR C-terminal-related transcriptional regulator [Streptomyces aurantiacus]|uniref:DNA-binding response regulator n=1 Tax=Streptomyces aurantiacus TaxID=47760 RepID=A0A7G1NUP8_9ACTN|nr:response regulator transcription factor [Streptomyces aurantiacus]MDQ0771967.1 DNA-binding NarL/FixJ family response regulator [Streptomyces aurantiacus]BCL25354.1 DNA-binding response regulator [Streptomyces aurantiacus]